MPLVSGQSISHYRIDRKIGEGGMGEVWAATDTRLNRPAAIKTLPPELASDAERLARFKREAQLLASLSHPNIAGVYGLEEVGQVPYLALELVEGDDLAVRLRAGRIPVDDAIEFAKQIAAALVEAHDKGIIHRDLKPANVKITPEGKVKVLDFGLAKAVAGDSMAGTTSADASRSPTLTAAMGTQAGLILGTAAYMPPEQARGRAVDRRADVWAFGVVLFEMLAGERMFTGETITDVIAAVVTRDPDWSRLPSATPPGVRRLLGRCLQKDPRMRLRDMGDALLDLSEPAGDASTGAAAPTGGVAVGRGRLAIFGGAGVAVGLLLALLVATVRAPPPEESRPTWSNLVPPATAAPEFERFLEISPDGRHLAFVALGTDGTPLLWVRDLTSEAARPLPGTAGALMPFWSPDSRSIAYFSERGLRRISVDGGVPVLITAAGDSPRGGCWGADGTILFVPDWSLPVFRIPEGGGTAEQVTTLRPELLELSHRWPRFLPDGRHFLYYAVSTYPELNPDNPSAVDKSGLYLGSFDGTEPRLLQTARSRAAYVQGSLLFVDDGILTARPFDVQTLAFTGPPVSIAEKVTQSVDALWGGGLFSVSDEGSLMFVRGASERNPLSRLVWRDRQGGQLETFGEPAAYNGLRLSHDGRRVATDIDDPADLWILDLKDGSSTRFTFDPGNDVLPVWSPDDSRILFGSSRILADKTFSAATLFLRATSGLELETLVKTSSHPLSPSDWSSDGQLAVVGGYVPERGEDILIYSFEKGTIETFLGTEHDESNARLSPDGRWLAYASSESGRLEVYVQTFPKAGGKWQISTQGGSRPAWRADGRELYFLDRDRALMAVPIDPERFRAGTPIRLFESRVSDFGDLGSAGDSYDVAPDGKRFLFLEPIEESENRKAVITLVRNWTAPGNGR